jgi:hypothetical protein
MRWVIGAAIVVGLAFGLTQAIIPNRAEQDVEDRLTRDGGSADVTVKAIPAIRLLFDDGDVLDVDARGINIPIEDLRGGSFKELDGFDEVKVRLLRSEVGPFTANRVLLERDEGEENYSFTYRGSTSAGQLADFALGALPPTLRTLIEAIGGRPADTAIPIRLDAELKSQGGRADLVSGRGTVAGLPLGGIALPLAGAIISRLTG